MNLQIIQKIVNVKNKCDIDIKVNNIVTDSKEVRDGDLFLAINSGYLYIEDAIKNGAVAIITDVDNLNYSGHILLVDDSKRALRSLASYKRSQYKGKVIAITGSNGKTTTKELLKHVLSTKYSVLANPQSQNNILGISKTLLRLGDNYDFLILELGMNHKGEILELSNLVKPNIGIITNIGTSHIGYLGSKDNIFKAKMEILEANPDMILFLNGSDEYLKKVEANLVIPERIYSNVHPVSSSLVLAVSKYLNFNEDEADNLIKSFEGAESRMQIHQIDNHIVIDDAYNASYESFVNGLEHVTKYKNRKIIIFGDMLELGDYSTYYHQKVLDKIKEIDNFVLITVGQETSHLNNSNHFYELDSLKDYLKAFKWLDDDLIYLKASHKVNLSSLISFFQYLW